MTGTRSMTFLASLAAMPLVAVALAGCGGGGNNASGSSAPPARANGKPVTLGVTNSGLGKILVNSKGRTLYLFQKDTGTTSECTGACTSNWPPLRASGTPTVGGGLKASLVGTTTRSDGTRQVTYNGHPVYLFINDSKPGDTNGEGINAFGGNWYAVSPSGNQISGSSNGNGYGY